MNEKHRYGFAETRWPVYIYYHEISFVDIVFRQINADETSWESHPLQDSDTAIEQWRSTPR